MKQTITLISAELAKLLPQLALNGISISAQVDSQSQRWASPS